MFTFQDAAKPSRASSAARTVSRAILLAGLALPLAPLVQTGWPPDAPPPQAQAVPPGVGMGQPVTDAMAGMRFGLSPTDLSLYRRAFAAIDGSDWATVDATISHIQDRRLIGHIE